MTTYEKLPEGFVEVKEGKYQRGDIVLSSGRYVDALAIGNTIAPQLPCYRRAASPKFIVGETYQYRNGEKCRVLAVDSAYMWLGEPQPIVAMNIKTGIANYHCADGRLLHGQTSECDLLPLPRKVKVQGWINVYQYGGSSVLFPVRHDADKAAMPDRLACIHIEREVTEGEGIE